MDTLALDPVLARACGAADWDALLESYAKAVEVTKTGEPMDSLRED